MIIYMRINRDTRDRECRETDKKTDSDTRDTRDRETVRERDRELNLVPHNIVSCTGQFQ